MRPQCVRSRSVRLNNLSLIRHFGNPNETILPFLGSYLPQCERDSDDLLKKTKYLWQDTLEDLATKGEITTDTLLRAWILVSTHNKPMPPSPLLPKQAPEPVSAPDPLALTETDIKGIPPKDYDQFLEDVDTDTTSPLEAKRTSDDPVPDELDMEHDTFDTFAAVFKSWPYVTTHEHHLYGKILVLGQLSGRNKLEQLVYKGCKLNDDSFGKIGCISEYERKGLRDSTYRIKVLRLKHSVLKFWVNIDDPTRPKGQRDLDDMYRYFEILGPKAPESLRPLDSLAYSAMKNSIIML